MKANLESTTVKDISYLINHACLKAPEDASLERLADQLCASECSRVYLEDEAGRLTGVIQARQIAMKILELSRPQSDQQDMLPAITFVLNSNRGRDLSESPVTVQSASTLKQVLELMDQNHIREIAIVDDDHHLIGTLEAKNILAHYLRAKAEASL